MLPGQNGQIKALEFASLILQIIYPPNMLQDFWVNVATSRLEQKSWNGSAKLEGYQEGIEDKGAKKSTHEVLFIKG